MFAPTVSSASAQLNLLPKARHSLSQGLRYLTTIHTHGVDGAESGKRSDNRPSDTPSTKQLDHKRLIEPTASTSSNLYALQPVTNDDMEQFANGRLYHYTSCKGGDAILESGSLRASTKAKHSRYGVGQYFANVSPDQVVCAKVGAKLQGDEHQYSASELAFRFFNHGFTGRVRKAVSVDLRSLAASGLLYKIECPIKESDPRCRSKAVQLYVHCQHESLDLQQLQPALETVVDYPEPEAFLSGGQRVQARHFQHASSLLRYAIDKRSILVCSEGNELSTLLQNNDLYPESSSSQSSFQPSAQSLLQRSSQGVGVKWVRTPLRDVAIVVINDLKPQCSADHNVSLRSRGSNNMIKRQSNIDHLFSLEHVASIVSGLAFNGAFKQVVVALQKESLVSSGEGYTDALTEGVHTLIPLLNKKDLLNKSELPRIEIAQYGSS